MKVCYLCKKEKSLGEFHKDRNKRDNHHNKCKDCCKQYREKNKEKSREYQKKYRRENSKIIKTKRKNSQTIQSAKRKEKIQSDPIFKLKCYLRNRIYSMFKFKQWKKNKRTEEILGAEYEIVKTYIASTFTEGMTWENYGEWHIDHVIPLNSAETQEKLQDLCHYTNLQALWAFDNISKSDKIL